MAEFQTSVSTLAAKDVRGVSISSSGDQQLHGKPPYIPCTIPLNHSLFKRHHPTSVSFQLGFPLIVVPHPDQDVQDLQDDEKLGLALEPPIIAHENHIAEALIKDMSSRGTSWGMPSPSSTWDFGGTMLVVRSDRKIITVQQVEVLVRYIQEVLEPGIEILNNLHHDLWLEKEDFGDEYKAKQDFNARFVTREAFEAFFDGFRKEKIQQGGKEEWEEVTLPIMRPKVKELLEAEAKMDGV